MTAFSLDDIGDYASQSVKPKKKATVKAKSTAKKAKVVSSTTRVKKKKKKPVDDFETNIELQKKAKAKKVKIKKSGKKSDEKIKKEAKKKKVPAKIEDVVAQGQALDAQLVEVVDAIPDVVRQENEQIEEYITMFKTCRELARAAEKQYFKSKQAREIYPLMQIYNQMRDIIADLRALRDVGKLGEILNDEVLSPFAQSTASILINVQQKMASYYKSSLPEREIGEATRALNKAIKEAAQDITKSYHASLDKTVQVFST